MYSASTSHGTLRDSFSAKTSSLIQQATARSLWCKEPNRAQYTPCMDSSTSYPTVYSELPRKISSTRIRYSHGTKRQTYEARHPAFVSKLSKKLPAYDTPPPYATEENFRDTVPQASIARYPTELRG